MRPNPKCGRPVLALGLLTTSLFTADLVNRSEPDWWLTPRRMIQTNLREIDAKMDVEAYVASLSAANGASSKRAVSRMRVCFI